MSLDHGPCPPQGWHLKILFIVNHKPLIGPMFRNRLQTILRTCWRKSTGIWQKGRYDQLVRPNQKNKD